MPLLSLLHLFPLHFFSSNSGGQEFEYIEQFPLRLLSEFASYSGHDVDRTIVVSMEYGANFSGPGKDIFRIDRAVGEPREAHKSNFLHPVLYYYTRLPTGKSFTSCTQFSDSLQHWPGPLYSAYRACNMQQNWLPECEEDKASAWRHIPINSIGVDTHYLHLICFSELRIIYELQSIKIPPSIMPEYPCSPLSLHNHFFRSCSYCYWCSCCRGCVRKSALVGESATT